MKKISLFSEIFALIKVLSSKFSYQRDKSIVDEIIRLQKNFIKPKVTNLLSNKDLSMPKNKIIKEQSFQ